MHRHWTEDTNRMSLGISHSMSSYRACSKEAATVLRQDGRPPGLCHCHRHGSPCKVPVVGGWRLVGAVYQRRQSYCESWMAKQLQAGRHSCSIRAFAGEHISNFQTEGQGRSIVAVCRRSRSRRRFQNKRHLELLAKSKDSVAETSTDGAQASKRTCFFNSFGALLFARKIFYTTTAP